MFVLGSISLIPKPCPNNWAASELVLCGLNVLQAICEYGFFEAIMLQVCNRDEVMAQLFGEAAGILDQRPASQTS